MANWSELHHDLLVEIARRIKLYEDFVSFRWVCTSWRWAATIKNFMYKVNQMPLLLHMPLDCGGTNQRCFLTFFSLSRGMSRHVLLQEADSYRNCLSSKGWLLRLHVQNLNASLLNPFSRVQLELPNMRMFKPWEYCVDYPLFFKKFVVSSSNLERHSDYTVMLIYGSERRLACFKPGQESWITVDTGNSYKFHDVVCHKGRFYAIDWHGYIFVCDFTGNVPNNLIVVARMSVLLLVSSSKLYVVESGGALLVVMRSRANKFQVFEVDLTTKTCTKVKDLGNRALFLGLNSSFSIEILDSSICKRNSIYFTDDSQVEIQFTDKWKVNSKDMGIYDIGDGSTVPHFMGKSSSRIAPPMWVEQSYFS